MRLNGWIRRSRREFPVKPKNNPRQTTPNAIHRHSAPCHPDCDMTLIINGEAIEAGILDDEFSRIKAHFESLGRVSCCERDPEFRGMARDNIIGRVLIMQEAEHQGLEVAEEEVGRAFARMVDEHGGAKEHLLLDAGLSLDEEAVFLEDLRLNLRLEKMLAEISGDPADPGDAELRRVYAENVDLFKSAEEVRASHIFKSSQPVERAREIYDELRDVRRRAVAGEDFDELAKEFSDKPEDEIDLGFFKWGELMDEFDSVCFSMDVGEVSPVIMSQWGYHLAKLTGRKPAEAPSFEDARGRVLELFRDEQKRKRIDTFVTGLKEKAEIEGAEDDDDDEN